MFEVLDISYLIGGGTQGAAARKELVVWSWDQEVGSGGRPSRPPPRLG